MLISNVTGNFFLKQNDTATQMRLRISEVDGTSVDLSLASRVEVVIGVNEGRVLVKTPIILSELGELEFGLDEGDILPVGDDLLEVHIYNDALEKRVAPSKGYYKLKVQKPIDELDVEVTTYTLDYFIGEVNRITQGLPELVVRAEDLADRLDVILVDSEIALEQSTTTLSNANTALNNANTAVANANTATASANAATNAAGVAATGATSAATSANNASQSATNAASVASAAATGATSATSAANLAADAANVAANLAEGISDDLLGYNIAITDFNVNTTYIKHQPARFNGSTFRAKVETTGNPLPLAPERENAWWTLEAQRGVDGTGSVGSVNGVQPDSNGNVDLGSLNADWANITSKPTTFTPSTHEHTTAQVAGLTEFIQGANAHVANMSNPHNITKAQIGLGSVENLGLATQVEAEAGTSAVKYMTPQRTNQAIVKGLEPLQQQITAHLDQNNDTLITVTRDISLSGLQTVSTPFKIKSATALAVIDDTQVSADCLWHSVNGGKCVLSTNTYKFGAGHFLQLSTASGNYAIANIKNVTDTSFDLEWNNAGSITGTAKVYILVRTH